MTKSLLLALALAVLPFSVFAQNKSCLTCAFSMSEQSAIPGQANACEDLYGAACVNKKGSSKYEGQAGQDKLELLKPVREARNKAAQALGYKDIDEAMKAKLKEAGITLKEPVDANSWKNLIGEGDAWSSGSGALYQEVAQCEAFVKELQSLNYYSEKDPATLKAFEAKYRSFFAIYGEKSIQFYAQDIPNFYATHFAQICSTLKSSIDSINMAENAELIKSCDNMLAVKREAIDLFRDEDSPDYKAKAQEFVKKHMLPAIKYKTSATVETYEGYTPEGKEAAIIKERIRNLNNSANCYTYSSIVESSAKKVSNELLTTIAKSKPAVESLVDSVYSKEKQKISSEIFQSTKSDVQDLIRGLVKDPNKRAEIIDGYDNLKLHWMSKPEPSSYIKDKSGMMLLNEDVMTLNRANTNSYIFFDPQLGYFTDFNAFYNTETGYGKQKLGERVDMQPAIMASLEKNPYVYLTVISHEVGHKIGPQIGKANGHDLSTEYQELLACYKHPKSMKLQESQKEETISDYVASEVLARQVRKLPAEKRTQAVLSAMEGYCSFDKPESISCKYNHPEASLRVSGVFGANPSIRKILGCEGESSKYRTCGLKTSLLDLPETGTASPTDVRSESSKGAK